jgi:hypothetical protein
VCFIAATVICPEAGPNCLWCVSHTPRANYKRGLFQMVLQLHT